MVDAKEVLIKKALVGLAQKYGINPKFDDQKAILSEYYNELIQVSNDQDTYKQAFEEILKNYPKKMPSLPVVKQYVSNHEQRKKNVLLEEEKEKKEKENMEASKTYQEDIRLGKEMFYKIEKDIEVIRNKWWPRFREECKSHDGKYVFPKDPGTLFLDAMFACHYRARNHKALDVDFVKTCIYGREFYGNYGKNNRESDIGLVKSEADWVVLEESINRDIRPSKEDVSEKLQQAPS